MSGADAFALFGAKPAFATPVDAAAGNFPAWEEFESAFRAIFERRFFTNNGPLLRELDDRFAETIGVAHAVCVTNDVVAVMIAVKALQLSGEVIVPALAGPHIALGLTWGGVAPVLCDVDETTLTASTDSVRQVLSGSTRAIAGVHLWGRACDPAGLRELADERGLALFFEATDAIGCAHGGRALASFGDVALYSFHGSGFLNAGEGGCITTDDPAIAARLRTIRNFYSSEAQVPLRINGKMTEAQAALVLLGLNSLSATVEANRARYAAYAAGLRGLSGVKLIVMDEQQNVAQVVADVDPAGAGLDRDLLRDLLAAENVVCGLAPAAGKLPVTERLRERLLVLPNSSTVTLPEVEQICDIIARATARADVLRERRSTGR